MTSNDLHKDEIIDLLLMKVTESESQNGSQEKSNCQRQNGLQEKAAFD